VNITRLALKAKKKYVTDSKEYMRLHCQAYRYEFKLKALKIYGLVCAECGMDDPDTLCFDHIGGVRKEDRSPSFIYRLVREPKREDIQILCANCNWKKQSNLYTRRSPRTYFTTKVKVLRAYSTTPEASCVLCGENDIELLCVDHIDGGGNKHKRTANIKGRLPTWLKKHNYPPGYRTLCFNCNLKSYIKLARARLHEVLHAP